MLNQEASIRLGLIVPPANATVEPEMAALVASRAVIHTTRLPGTVSEDTSRGLDARIDGYVAALPDVVRSFGGMHLDALCLMHTGCSYAVGLDGEEQLRTVLAHAGASHAFTAADAVAETLASLGCVRVALVVPYPDWLSRRAVAYWEARGLTVIGVVKPQGVVSIYDITPEAVLEAITRLDLRSAEAILLSGTGMATLRVLEAHAPTSEIPVVSANQCAAWQALSRCIGPRLELGSLAPALGELCNRLDRGGDCGERDCI